MFFYSAISRHLCLTLVALSLCQAFVTSSRFGMSSPFHVRRGGAAATPLSSSPSSDSKDSRVGPLGVLRAPPPSTTRRSRNGGGADEEGEIINTTSASAMNNNNKNILKNGASRRNGASSATNVNGKFRVPTTTLYSEPQPQPQDPSTQPLPLEDNGASAFRSQQVEYVAETKLPTDVGAFQLRGYRIPGAPLGQEPCVIYCRDKPPFGQNGVPAAGVPVRIHDQCLTSEVFRSQR